MYGLQSFRGQICLPMMINCAGLFRTELQTVSHPVFISAVRSASMCIISFSIIIILLTGRSQHASEPGLHWEE